MPSTQYSMTIDLQQLDNVRLYVHTCAIHILSNEIYRHKNAIVCQKGVRQIHFLFIYDLFMKSIETESHQLFTGSNNFSSDRVHVV